MAKEEKRLNYKGFWITLGVVFIISMATVLLGPHLEITGHAVQTISLLKGGTEFTMGTKDVSGVQQAVIPIKETIKNGRIDIVQDDTIPFKGNSYSKFRISSTDEDKIGTIKLTLKIEEAVLYQAGIAQSEVTLFTNNKPQATTFLRKEGRYLYYETSSSEFGSHVIGAIKEVPKEEPVEEAPAEEVVPEPTPEPVVEEKPIVGQAAADPGFFSKVGDFFRNLFN